jgi:hypothetical protein
VLAELLAAIALMVLAALFGWIAKGKDGAEALGSATFFFLRRHPSLTLK